MVEKNFHYRWDFYGLSTDVKPTPETSEKVVDGSTFYCSDTSKLYVFCKDDWYERKPLGGGGGGTTDYTRLSNLPQINGVELIGDKTSVELGLDNPEVQIFGWSRIAPDEYHELDLRPYIEQGYETFTILVYIRLGEIRQGVKFELTISELEKFLGKTQKNMLCITRMCVDPDNQYKMAMLKQCVQQVYDGDTRIDGLIKIKYTIWNSNAVQVTTMNNFEWCFYAR